MSIIYCDYGVWRFIHQIQVSFKLRVFIVTPVQQKLRHIFIIHRITVKAFSYGCPGTFLIPFGLPDNRNCLLSYGNQETSENFRRCLSNPDLSGCIEDTVISYGCPGTVLTSFGLPDNRNSLLSFGN
jgi:hypothetical protein